MNLDTAIYRPDMFLAENELAFFMGKLLNSRVEHIPWKTDGLLHKQPEAVINACTKSVSILTGPPGTGKTTTLQQIVKSFDAAGLSGIVCCPTGKAAKRADEVINVGRNFVNRIQCSTTHSALEYDGMSMSFGYNRSNRFRWDYVLMDEFSMQECMIMRDFIEAINPGKTRVVFCGDQYQLPSVGPGNVARDMIESNVIPAIELDVVLRTGPNSGITYNANRILRGQDICKSNLDTGDVFSDFFMVPRDEQSTQKSILQWVCEDIPKKRGLDPLRDIQVMAPGKNGLVGTKLMNELLRAALVPDKTKETLLGFKVGDKVMNIKNKKRMNIVNGDVGFVNDVVRSESGSHITVDFGGMAGPNQNGITDLNVEDAGDIRLAFCTTIHKLQGSETPVAIIPVHTCHTMLLTRNLVYTGITRAKLLGMFVGDGTALKGAIKNTSSTQRRTRLKELLRREAA